MEKHKKKEQQKEKNKKTPPKVETVSKEAFDKLQEDYNETRNMLLRNQADFENYKKRVDTEKSDLKKYTEMKTISDLLPTIDTFEIALKNTKDSEEFLKGVELIYSNLQQLLKSKNIRPVEPLGEQFDPYKHEILMQQQSDDETCEDDNKIIEVLQKGYMFEEKVLRTAKVKILKVIQKQKCEKADEDNNQNKE